MPQQRAEPVHNIRSRRKQRKQSAWSKRKSNIKKRLQNRARKRSSDAKRARSTDDLYRFCYSRAQLRLLIRYERLPSETSSCMPQEIRPPWFKLARWYTSYGVISIENNYSYPIQSTRESYKHRPWVRYIFPTGLQQRAGRNFANASFRKFPVSSNDPASTSWILKNTRSGPKETIKPIKKSLIRNYKGLRGVKEEILPSLPDEDVDLVDATPGDSITVDKDSFTKRQTYCLRFVAEWKRGAGKNKDWKVSPLIDLQRRYYQSDFERYAGKYITYRIVAESYLHALDCPDFAAARGIKIPKGMLRRYLRKPNSSALATTSNIPCDIMKWPEFNYKDGDKPNHPYSPRKGKRYRQIELSEAISDGLFLQRSLGLSSFETLDADTDNEIMNSGGMVSQSDTYSSLACKNETTKTDSIFTSSALTMPYESHIGAIIGHRFVLRGCLHTKACYDVHIAKDLNDDLDYTAKAYTIRGSKGKERESRVKNLKRNAIKASCIASVDQNGKKWLFFFVTSDLYIENHVPSSSSAWLRQQQYYCHFPSLSPHRTSSYTGKNPLLTSYASCVQKSHVEQKDRFSKKREQARDRQQRKRKKERATKVATHRRLESDKAPSGRQEDFVEHRRSTRTTNKKSAAQPDVEQLKEEQTFQKSRNRPKESLNLVSRNEDASAASPHILDKASLTKVNSRSNAKSPMYDSGDKSQDSNSPSFDETLADLEAIGRDLQNVQESVERTLESCSSGEESESADIPVSSSTPRKEGDFVVISRFLYAAAVNREKAMYSESESAAVEYLLQMFYCGDDRASKAMQLLCDGDDEGIQIEEREPGDRDVVTYRLIREIVMQEDFGASHESHQWHEL